MNRKLPRGKRLKSRKEISRLFSREASVAKSFPIRAVYAVGEARGAFPVQVTFVVPKRKFKKAVDRNRIKRQLREAYRLNATYLKVAEQLPPGQQISLLFMYTGREEMDFAYISRKMRKVLSGVRLNYNLSTQDL